MVECAVDAWSAGGWDVHGDVRWGISRPREPALRAQAGSWYDEHVHRLRLFLNRS